MAARVAVLRQLPWRLAGLPGGPPAQATGTRGLGSHWQTSWVLDAAPEMVECLLYLCSTFPICCLSRAPQILVLFSPSPQGNHNLFSFWITSLSSGRPNLPFRASTGFMDHHSGNGYSPHAATFSLRLISLPLQKVSASHLSTFLPCLWYFPDVLQWPRPVPLYSPSITSWLPTSSRSISSDHTSPWHLLLLDSCGICVE